MTKYTNINGMNFITIHSGKTESMINEHFNRYKGRDLMQVYGKCSKEKKDVYYKWREWLQKTDEVTDFDIISASRYTFTLGAIYRDVNNTPIGYIRITKGYNRLYLIP